MEQTTQHANLCDAIGASMKAIVTPQDANDDVTAVTGNEPTEARRRWRKGRLVVTAVQKFKNASDEAAAGIAGIAVTEVPRAPIPLAISASDVNPSFAQAPAQNVVAPPAPHGGDAKMRWKKGRLLVVAANKFQQAGVDGAAKRTTESTARTAAEEPQVSDTLAAASGEEVRRRWRKGRLVVSAVHKFQQAGTERPAPAEVS